MHRTHAATRYIAGACMFVHGNLLHADEQRARHIFHFNLWIRCFENVDTHFLAMFIWCTKKITNVPYDDGKQAIAFIEISKLS